MRFIVVGMMLVALLAMPANAEVDDKPCNGIWYREAHVGPATVGTNGDPRCTTVEVGKESMQMEAKPTCNGIWYREFSFGPVTIGTDGSYRCTHVDVGRIGAF